VRSRPRRRWQMFGVLCMLLATCLSFLWLRSFYVVDNLFVRPSPTSRWWLASANGALHLQVFVYSRTRAVSDEEHWLSLRSDDLEGWQQRSRTHEPTVFRDRFKWVSVEAGGKLTIIAAPHWVFVLSLLAAGMVHPTMVYVRRRRRGRAGRCVECGYDLRGSSVRCPECGNTFSAVQRPPGNEEV
jgi:hypothetical protein